VRENSLTEGGGHGDLLCDVCVLEHGFGRQGEEAVQVGCIKGFMWEVVEDSVEIYI
jgi:hypothetical protein